MTDGDRARHLHGRYVDRFAPGRGAGSPGGSGAAGRHVVERAFAVDLVGVPGEHLRYER